jgi:hypothetical protein
VALATNLQAQPFADMIASKVASFRLGIGDAFPMIRDLRLPSKLNCQGAFGSLLNRAEFWIVVSSEPTSITTFVEYGFRFDIEENFLDDKSNGFQLEASLIRDAKILERLCFILAITTLFLVSQGTVVVEQGQRRLVDPHWFRGSSYLKIGWRWVKHALSKGWTLITRLYLPGTPDPEPARASRKQFAKKAMPDFRSVVADFASSTCL